ncbi:SIR2 family NAD-dependent protein deacylase [Mariprofundus erugo]|nr:Sir2 family NAD-dependent protein deacetylase [Mariprofundus erugo]
MEAMVSEHNSSSQAIAQAKQAIANADALLITAGAGMGVDSGLPDFRGVHGLWRAYPVLKRRGLSFEDMARLAWFRDEPELAWAFYGHRLHQYRQTQPHAGFGMLLDLCRQKGDNYFVVTSNVDSHFHKAGFDDSRIHEVHGSLDWWQCSSGAHKDLWPADDDAVIVDEERFRATRMPYCPDCGEVARPNVLMFGDWRWVDTRESRQAAHFIHWLEPLRAEGKQVAIIEIGAGRVIPTIRELGEHLFWDLFPYCSLIRINPRDHKVPEGAISIAMNGLDGIRSILGEV